jgi:hypothetical protein
VCVESEMTMMLNQTPLLGDKEIRGLPEKMKKREREIIPLTAARYLINKDVIKII